MAVDVALSWDLSPTTTNEVDGQRIYRTSTSSPTFPDDYSQIDSVGDSQTTYTDTGAPENETLTYAVTAFNSAGESDPTTDSVDTNVTITRSLTTGSSGASLSVRTIDSTRSATTGETGASASTRAVTKPRSTATGSAGASTVARAATKPRSAATGATGRSVAARVVDNIRRSMTGATGASTATRAAAKSRSTTTGETGASTSARVATVARSLTTGSRGRSLATRAFDNWRIDGEGLAVTPDLEATAETLTLTAEVGRDRLDALRDLGDRAGDLTTEDGHAGAFRALDRGGDSPVDVLAPVSERPPFPTAASFLIAGYSEDQLSPARFEVAVELQRVANRSEATAPDTLQTGDDWLLTLDSGETVGLSERQVGQLTREGAPPGADVALTVRVSSDQAGALLDRVGYPGGVVERSVPDGPDQRVDETGGRQTISVDAPSAASIASGDWFVTDWTLSFNSYSEGREWALELALAEP